MNLRIIIPFALERWLHARARRYEAKTEKKYPQPEKRPAPSLRLK